MAEIDLSGTQTYEVILTLLVVSGILSAVAYVHSTVQAKKRLVKDTVSCRVSPSRQEIGLKHSSWQEKDEQLENTVLKGLSTAPCQHEVVAVSQNIAACLLFDRLLACWTL